MTRPTPSVVIVWLEYSSVATKRHTSSLFIGGRSDDFSSEDVEGYRRWRREVKAMSTPRYSIRTYGPEDEQPVLNLLGQALRGWAVCSDRPGLWRWKHFANPFGPSHVCVACNEKGDLIGVLAFMRMRLRRGDEFIQSVRVVDAAMHPGYQKMGIAFAMRQRLLEAARRDGAILVFATPNELSLPLSIKGGSHLAGLIRPFIRVFNYRRLVLGLVRSRLNRAFSPHYEPRDFFRQEPQPVRAILERREELERLLEQDERHQERSFRIDRSWEYLRWRYGEHPLTTYYTVYREHRGELVGCAIFRTDTYRSLKGIVLNELLSSMSEERLAEAVLNQLEGILSADYLLTYFSEPSMHRRVLSRKGFLRLRRPAFNLTVGVWDPEIGKAPLHLDSWSLTPGDLEESWAWR